MERSDVADLEKRSDEKVSRGGIDGQGKRRVGGKLRGRALELDQGGWSSCNGAL